MCAVSRDFWVSHLRKSSSIKGGKGVPFCQPEFIELLFELSVLLLHISEYLLYMWLSWKVLPKIIL